MQKASVNMTARFSVKNSHIEYDLILVLKKQTPAVKVITVRLNIEESRLLLSYYNGRMDVIYNGWKEGRKI
jgi:hypothetical protein